MDGTERVEFGLAEDEFHRQHEKVRRERGIPSMLAACRDRAIFLTIEKFSKYLDRVVVQKLKGGRLDLTHRIFSDLFVDAKEGFFWKPISTDVVMIVDPYTMYDVDAQLLQSILGEISVKVKAGVLGKIILPKDFYYFTWKQRAEFDCDRLIRAKNFDEARSELLKEIDGQKYISDLKVFYDNQWYKLELTEE